MFTAAQRPAEADGARLLEALRRFDVTEVRRLAAAHANGRDGTGTTALMYAALYASPAEMRLLLDNGADPDAGNDFGSTPLMWAAGDPAKVDLLLSRGASVAAKTKRGHTALLAAANHGNVDAMRLLLARGADANAATL